MLGKKEDLLRERKRLLRELEEQADFIVGTLTRVRRAGHLQGGHYHLTYKNDRQKTVTSYISRELSSQAKGRIRKTIRVWKIISAISKLNIELLKLDRN